MAVGKGGGQLGRHRPQADKGTRSHCAGSEEHFPDPSFGLLALLPGTLSANLFSARHLPWDQGLTTCGLAAEDFGAHFPCPQAQWEPETFLPSPGLGQ